MADLHGKIIAGIVLVGILGSLLRGLHIDEVSKSWPSTDAVFEELVGCGEWNEPHRWYSQSTSCDRENVAIGRAWRSPYLPGDMMATNLVFVEYVAEQAQLDGRLTHRKMFGELVGCGE